MDGAESVGGTCKGWIEYGEWAAERIKQMGNPATAAAVDAYKTYLYRRGNRSVKEIECTTPGQLINLSELNKDIAATKSLLYMCEASNLPVWDVEYKLKSLRALLATLNGKTWPSVSEIKQQAKDAASLYKAADTSIKEILLAQAKAELEVQKAKNAPVIAPKPAPKPAKKGYLQIPKPNPYTKPAPAFSAVVKIEQEWLMRVGMVSNCNVSITQTVGYVILTCKVCAIPKRVENSAVSGSNTLTVDIEQFCRDHRHDQKPETQPRGRFFREED